VVKQFSHFLPSLVEQCLLNSNSSNNNNSSSCQPSSYCLVPNYLWQFVPCYCHQFQWKANATIIASWVFQCAAVHQKMATAKPINKNHWLCIQIANAKATVTRFLHMQEAYAILMDPEQWVIYHVIGLSPCCLV